MQLIQKANELIRFDKDITESDADNLKNYKYVATDYTIVDNFLNKYWVQWAEYLPRVPKFKSGCSAKHDNYMGSLQRRHPWTALRDL